MSQEKKNSDVVILGGFIVERTRMRVAQMTAGHQSIIKRVREVGMVYFPIASLDARMFGRLASRIFCCAFSISYGTRRNVITLLYIS